MPSLHKPLGRTDLAIYPLCLGGNVFGWTANEAESFAVLDAYAEAGGNFIDTADVYSSWVPGHVGGESEAILGRWMKARGNRDRMVIATKVGKLAGLTKLDAATIENAIDGSLERLQTDRIDLYYAHSDDAETPLAETMQGFDAVVRKGKARYIAASNFTALRLGEALAISTRDNLARFVALQPHYNLLERGGYEGALAEVCEREGVACVPYFALAMGFLTGKYRIGVKVDGPRSDGASKYLDARGLCVLDALDKLGAHYQRTDAAVALAWLAAQKTVAAPIASARTVEQVRSLIQMTELTLTQVEIERLTKASEVGHGPPVEAEW